MSFKDLLNGTCLEITMGWLYYDKIINNISSRLASKEKTYAKIHFVSPST